MSGDNFLKKHSLVLDLVILLRMVRVVFRFPPGDQLLPPVQEGNGLCLSEGPAFETGCRHC